MQWRRSLRTTKSTRHLTLGLRGCWKANRELRTHIGHAAFIRFLTVKTRRRFSCKKSRQRFRQHITHRPLLREQNQSLREWRVPRRRADAAGRRCSASSKFAGEALRCEKCGPVTTRPAERLWRSTLKSSWVALKSFAAGRLVAGRPFVSRILSKMVKILKKASNWSLFLEKLLQAQNLFLFEL